MKKVRFTTRDIAYISLFSVLLIISSWICIPTPIPFTMQNFGIVFTTLTLGRRRAFFSVLIYLLAGLIGFPVFAGFRSGLGVLTSPTGGYILGMLFLPIIIGRKSERHTNHILSDICSCTFAMLALYLFGSLWYMFLFAQNANGLFPILSVCVFPFLVPDAIKCILGVVCAKKFRTRFLSR